MAPKNALRIFLDTSVIFAAVLSAGGGARKLFQLAEAGLLVLVVSPNVLRECEEVARHKSPSSLPLLARLLAVCRVETSAASTGKDVVRARRYVKHPPDALILADAIHAGPDWLISHDRAHFLKMHSEGELPFRVGTPGDLIQFLKNEFRS